MIALLALAAGVLTTIVVAIVLSGVVVALWEGFISICNKLLK